MTTITMQPDMTAIKERQQATWASGDYHMIGTQILLVSEMLIEALDVHSTESVLDVATGSGNAAMAAARRGCTVVGIDYVPSLLDRARRRTEAEGLSADYIEADAEALPFGVCATRPIRPPGRVTRASSFAVWTWSGANIAPKTEVTTSKLASSNGSASASASM